MGLRGRLALIFIAITVVPPLVASAVLQLQISVRAARPTLAAVDEAGTASAERIRLLRDRAGDQAALLGIGEGAEYLSQADPAADVSWMASAFNAMSDELAVRAADHRSRSLQTDQRPLRSSRRRPGAG